MATIIDKTTDESSNFAIIVVAIIALTLLGIVFFVYISPAIQTPPVENTQDTSDSTLNVNATIPVVNTNSTGY